MADPVRIPPTPQAGPAALAAPAPAGAPEPPRPAQGGDAAGPIVIDAAPPVPRHAGDAMRARKLGRFEGEGWRVRKDGTRVWANVIITAIVACLRR